MTQFYPSLIIRVVACALLLFFSCPALAEGEDANIFKNFAANEVITTKHTVKPVIDTPHKRRYRTRLTALYEQSPNFAGAYHITSFGCGSGCRKNWMLHIPSGRLTELPTTTRGLLFKVDSRLLVVNPPFTLQDTSWHALKQQYADTKFLLLTDGKITPYKKPETIPNDIIVPLME